MLQREIAREETAEAKVEVEKWSKYKWLLEKEKRCYSKGRNVFNEPTTGSASGKMQRRRVERGGV